jgi:hypothetical protein
MIISIAFTAGGLFGALAVIAWALTGPETVL